MAELADALDSGSNEGSFVQVQVLLPAPYRVFITDLSYGHSIFFSVGLDFGVKIRCSLFLWTSKIIFTYDII